MTPNQDDEMKSLFERTLIDPSRPPKDTPRTDAEKLMAACVLPSDEDMVRASFARDLERELARCRCELAKHYKRGFCGQNTDFGFRLQQLEQPTPDYFA